MGAVRSKLSMSYRQQLLALPDPDLSGISGSSQIAAQWFFTQAVSGSDVPEDMRAGTVRPIQPGRCLSFDGVNDYVLASAITAGAPSLPFSVCGWARATGASGTDRALVTCLNAAASNSYMSIYRTTADKFAITRRNTTLVTNGTNIECPIDSWFHWAIVWESATAASFYLNGDLVWQSTSLTSVTPSALADDVLVGLLRTVSPQWYWLGRQFDVRVYDHALLASEVASIRNTTIKPDQKPANGLFADTLSLHLKLDDPDTTTRDSANGDTASQSGSPSIYEGNDVPISWRNEVGYRAGAIEIPQHSKLPHLNTAGGVIDLTGEVPRNAKLLASNCATFDGVDDHVLAAHLAGTETVTSSGGTSTPTVSAGRIDFTAGTCWDLVLDDGTIYPLAEGNGTTAYDVSGSDNHGTITSATNATFWGATQNSYHRNITNGFSHEVDYQTMLSWTPALPFKAYLVGTKGACDFDPTDGKISTSNIYYVKTTGNDLNSGLTPALAKQTIGSAITAANNAAVSDAEIRVDPGIYPDSIGETIIPNFNMNLINTNPAGEVVITGTDNTVDILRVNVAGTNHYLESLIFDGGARGVFADGVGYVVSNKCTFRNTLAPLGINGYEGRGVTESYLVDCVAHNNENDGYGYRGTSKTLELRCTAYNNGDGVATSDNGSTCHESAVILRINCEYYGHPKNVSDINDSKAINLGVVSRDATEISGINHNLSIANNHVGYYLGGDFSTGGDVHTETGTFVHHDRIDWAGNTFDTDNATTAVATFYGTRIPARNTGGAADGTATRSAAGVWHNGAETKIDFTGDEADAPWTEGLSLPATYQFNDALPAIMRKRLNAQSGEEIYEDNFYVLKQ